MIIADFAKLDPWTVPITLEGRQLRLEPLDYKHLDDLSRNILSPNTWHAVHWGTRSRADLEKTIERSHQVRRDKLGNSFAMVLKRGGEVVGISRLMSFNRQHNYLEIGGTWIGEKWQKTFVNTEAKLLMLTYIFENLRCQRVEFRVDSLNFNSQRGVLRLGAKYEGELRNSSLFPDGRKRDYKVYSIIDSEWPNIKTTLHWYLDKYV
jgi:RimJ/RimL family protein N-acetyltransferase